MSEAVIVADRRIELIGGQFSIAEEAIVESVVQCVYLDAFSEDSEEYREVEELVAQLFDALEEKRKDNSADEDDTEIDLERQVKFLEERVEQQDAEIADLNLLHDQETVDIIEKALLTTAASLKTLSDFMGVEANLIEEAIRRMKNQEESLKQLQSVNRVLNENMNRLVHRADAATPLGGVPYKDRPHYRPATFLGDPADFMGKPIAEVVSILEKKSKAETNDVKTPPPNLFTPNPAPELLEVCSCQSCLARRAQESPWYA